jgi:outer membrane lipoprotein carrier protein
MTLVPRFATIAPLILIGAVSASGLGSQQLTPDELARAVQRRYETIRDFSAKFEHTYRGGVLRTKVTERGVATIKKPGLMRWIYESPERKEFVSDGQHLYSYFPQDRQVVVSRISPEEAAPLPILFLAGKGEVSKDFAASLPANDQEASIILRLTPRSPSAEYAHMLLVLDASSLQIRGLTTVDLQGGSSAFTFTNLQENLGFSDKLFTFRIPKGVDVLTDDDTL